MSAFFQRIGVGIEVSVLFNEPKLLKLFDVLRTPSTARVSVLFNEPKLLKSSDAAPASA